MIVSFLITIGILAVLVLLLKIIFNPRLDYIIVGGKKRTIMWYNNLLKMERDWTFI